MTNEISRRSGWIIALVIIVVLASVIGGAKFAYPRKSIQITLTTNGVAQLYGIPLGNGTVRRTVFSIIKVLKPKESEVRIRVPADGRNYPGLTNLLTISAELKRAGLTSPPPPNAYE